METEIITGVNNGFLAIGAIFLIFLWFLLDQLKNIKNSNKNLVVKLNKLEKFKSEQIQKEKNPKGGDWEVFLKQEQEKLSSRVKTDLEKKLEEHIINNVEDIIKETFESSSNEIVFNGKSRISFKEILEQKNIKGKNTIEEVLKLIENHLINENKITKHNESIKAIIDRLEEIENFVGFEGLKNRLDNMKFDLGVR